MRAFGKIASKEKDDEYFRLYSRSFDAICRTAGCSREDLIAIRDHAAPAFIDFCVDAIDWNRFGLVGFSVVFQQLLARLALARAPSANAPICPSLRAARALRTTSPAK